MGNKKQKTKKQMRFTLAIAALLSTSDAVRLMKKGGDDKPSFRLDDLFHKMDLNGDGYVTPEEGHKAITDFAAEHKIELPEGWEKEAMDLFEDIDAATITKLPSKKLKL